MPESGLATRRGKCRKLVFGLYLKNWSTRLCVQLEPDDDAAVATSFLVQFSFYLDFIFEREYPVSEAVKEKGTIFKGN